MTVSPLHPQTHGTPTDLCSVFRRAVSSVWIITCAGQHGPVGMTALSVASVSLKPPLVSFNLNRTSASLAEIDRSRRVALHLLSDGQHELPARFAGDRARRFVADGTWSLDDEGLPRVHGVSARLVADVIDLHPAGDSMLAVAQVSACESASRHEPLAHHDGAVHRVLRLGA